ADHTATSAGWNSGVLAAGGSYKVKLNATGVFPFSDGADADSTGSITVGDPPVAGSSKVYLPVVSK
ncbi:MAG: hypothetical protein HC793_01830, partial [Aquincola sp.]|nr:hypothetical protein [Aquincola sp.]